MSNAEVNTVLAYGIPAAIFLGTIGGFALLYYLIEREEDTETIPVAAVRDVVEEWRESHGSVEFKTMKPLLDATRNTKKGA